MKNFTATESAFYDYLRGRQYTHRTAYDYIGRLRKIESVDTLISKDLSSYIEDYTIGAHQEFDITNHHTYSNALKRLQEMQRDVVPL